MTTNTIRTALKVATLALTASLAACGGGGGGSSPAGGTAGGGNGGGNSVFVPSQTQASQTQAAAGCGAPTYAAGSTGAWVMDFRGAAGSNTASRGAVCQSAALDTLAASVTAGTTVSQVQQNAAAAGYAGTILDVEYATGVGGYDCTELANFRARSLYAQGRLTDVGAFTSAPDGSGNVTCALVAGAKAGTDKYGQLPASDISAFVHLYAYPASNYVIRSNTGGYDSIDINFNYPALADSCAAGTGCLPPQIVSVRWYDSFAQEFVVSSQTPVAETYQVNNTLMQQYQTVTNTMAPENSTIRYLSNAGCGSATCTLEVQYIVNGTVKIFTKNFTSTTR